MSISDDFPWLQNLRKLNAGGQKEVYAGTHDEYGPVVLKLIKKSSSSIDLERTRREIRAVEKLRSSHVPRIFTHNADEDSSDQLFIVEEYVDAPTLRQTLVEGRRYSTREVVRFLETMLSIVQEAERVQIVHRDIKPENILIDNRAKYWLLDFGIARHLDLTSITPTDWQFGLFTLGYAASEQARNLKRQIDSRVDLFAVAVVAAEMYTGVNKYVHGARDPIEVLRRLDSTPVPWISFEGDRSQQLSTFVRVLGDHHRNRRPRTAKDALRLLGTVKATLEET